MIIKRTLKIVAFLVPLAILYVWQNTQTFKLAYEMENKAGAYKELLEKNSLLRYNINVRMSSQEIGESFLSKDNNLKIADSIFVVKAKSKAKETPAIYSKIGRENRLLRFFSPPAEAESRP